MRAETSAVDQSNEALFIEQIEKKFSLIPEVIKRLNSDCIRNAQFNSVSRLMKNMTFSTLCTFVALDIVVYFNSF